MEKLEIISLVCTLGVVTCGLTVIIAATVRVVKDIFKNTSHNPIAMTAAPTWEMSTVTTVTEEKPRRRRRSLGSTAPYCDCGEDLSKAQIIRSESHDDKTFLIKECPSCKKECSIESK